MIAEIGSEFHEGSTQMGDNLFDIGLGFENMRFVQSGRTGLALIAAELQLLQNFKTIALPTYCCSSMVYPFYNKGISVVFYPIPTNFEISNKEDIDNALFVINKADAVLCMDYFGYVRDFAFQLAKKAKSNNKKVIVDATQTAFSKSKTYSMADYVLISYRKWSDLLCASVFSKTGYGSDLYKDAYDDFNQVWRNAAHIKRGYLHNVIHEKSGYLKLYQQANSMLSNKYEDYSAKNGEIEKLKQIDSEFLVSKRRGNAKFLIEALNDYKRKYAFELLFECLKDDDCPLFVPILVNEKKRDLIRKKLADKEIFCPAHWPIDSRYPFCETPYHRCEISLVCDQRYGAKDMEREVYELISALNEV